MRRPRTDLTEALRQHMRSHHGPTSHGWWWPRVDDSDTVRMLAPKIITIKCAQMGATLCSWLAALARGFAVEVVHVPVHHPTTIDNYLRPNALVRSLAYPPPL